MPELHPNFNIKFIQNSFLFSEYDDIPWCTTGCLYDQPNEPGVGCNYLEYNHSILKGGVGDYPCGDLDVIQIAPEKKQECFVNFIEPEDCSRSSLCLTEINSDEDNGAESAVFNASTVAIITFLINLI